LRIPEIFNSRTSVRSRQTADDCVRLPRIEAKIKAKIKAARFNGGERFFLLPFAR
jgi:hypothetical protein